MSINQHLTKLLSEKTEEKFDLVGQIMAYEEGELSTEDTLNLFSHLIKSGKAWSLQGSYGRTATALINAGYIDKTGKILKTECTELLKTESTINEKTNMDVINMFMSQSFPIDKKPNWGTQHLRINKERYGWSVINYATPILYRENGSDKVFMNKDKYSVTTSKIQNQMRRSAEENDIKLTEVNEEKIQSEIDTSSATPSSGDFKFTGEGTKE